MSIYGLILVVAFLLAWIVLGLSLLRRGRHGESRGVTPHCGRCGYNLTGLQSQRCPECGADLGKDKAIAVGRRVRQPGMMAVGVVVTLIGLLPLLGISWKLLKRVYWYQFAPTSWVMADTEAQGGWQRYKAFNELARRQWNGDLSAEETHQYVEKLLAVHAALTIPRHLSSIVPNMLFRLHESGCLSEEQWTRHLEQARRATLCVRPKMITGRRVPVEVRVESRTVSLLQVSSEVRELWLDGEPVSVETPPWEDRRHGRELIHMTSLPPVALGRHVLTCTVVTGVEALNEPEKKFESIHSRELKLTAEFEVLAPGSEAEVKPVRSPDLDVTVPACFAVQLLHVSNRYDWTVGVVRPTLRSNIVITGPLPVGVAFDVLAVFGDQSATLGRITATKGSYSFPWHVTVEGDVPFEMPARVDILLKASPDAALESVDLFEIWGGDVRLQNVGVSSHEYLERLRQRQQEPERTP